MKKDVPDYIFLDWFYARYGRLGFLDSLKIGKQFLQKTDILYVFSGLCEFDWRGPAKDIQWVRVILTKPFQKHNWTESFVQQK